MHEGGHATVALHLGIRFEAVELRLEAVDGYWHCGGRLRGAELPEIADNPRLWSQLIVIMAGYAAESLLAPSTGFSIAEFSFPDDRDHAAAVAILRAMHPPILGSNDTRAAMEQAWHEAREIVAANWQNTTAIADELVRLTHPTGEPVACHLTLTPRDLASLLAGVKSSRGPAA